VAFRDDLDRVTARPVTLIVNRLIGMEDDPDRMADTTFPTASLLNVLLRLDSACRGS
jgi:hypothetical protein